MGFIDAAAGPAVLVYLKQRDALKADGLPVMKRESSPWCRYALLLARATGGIQTKGRET
ncbi:hypothetical protein KBY77_06335 [Synechococcus sp. Cruz-7E5]|nr:hypothetical protein [Synechococcus sp. Cruz-7E5]